MNEKASLQMGYVRPQQKGEEIANAISHGLAAVAAIAGTIFLMIEAIKRGTALHITCFALYGASMFLLYLFSYLYHALTVPRGKGVMRVFDHCSIFLLILGSYIPVALLVIGGMTGWILVIVNTLCAILGVTLNAISLSRWQKFSLILYLIMGWSAIWVIRPVFLAIPLKGLLLLVGGGLAYTAGIVFYKMKMHKYMHFVWHLFVIAGSTLHYFFIYYYCC